MGDIKSREDIALLVNLFYQKVQADKLISPIFTQKIQPEQWPEHLGRMTSFWSMVLLQQKDYKGNPFRHHIGLNIDKSHFDRWIAIFEKTINENFEGVKAQEAIQRANSIREIFENKLKFMGSGDNL